MRHGSLFSGIGGFDLAAEWMGWENVFHCEWNEFGQKVLHHYWPNAETFTDITKSDFTKYANKIDILTGGFPCQPYSMAGKRKGKEDERHLWPSMLRAIREIKPKYIVGENVFGLLNWNGGMVFDEVHSDLEFEGYEVQAVVIPAAAVNAPHGRDRVWFVAHSKSARTWENIGGIRGEFERCDKRKQDELFATNTNNTRTHHNIAIDRNGEEKNEKRGRQSQFEYRADGYNGDVANSQFKSTGSNGGINNETEGNLWGRNKGDVFGTLCSDGDVTDTTSPGGGKNNRQGESRFNDQTSKGNNWDNFPTQSPICGGDDGIPTELDGITFSKWRNESIKAYGNAIVPQVAYEIFKAIQRTI